MLNIQNLALDLAVLLEWQNSQCACTPQAQACLDKIRAHCACEDIEDSPYHVAGDDVIEDDVEAVARALDRLEGVQASGRAVVEDLAARVAQLEALVRASASATVGGTTTPATTSADDPKPQPGGAA